MVGYFAYDYPVAALGNVCAVFPCNALSTVGWLQGPHATQCFPNAPCRAACPSPAVDLQAKIPTRRLLDGKDNKSDVHERWPQQLNHLNHDDQRRGPPKQIQLLCDKEKKTRLLTTNGSSTGTMLPLEGLRPRG